MCLYSYLDLADGPVDESRRVAPLRPTSRHRRGTTLVTTGTPTDTTTTAGNSTNRSSLK